MRILYTRYEDGCQPVTVIPGTPHPSYTLAGKTYRSARQLLVAITRHPAARNWTFDRYFRLGRYQPASLSPVPSFDLLAYLTPAPRVEAAPVTLGVDLAKRGREVAKILYAGFGSRIHGAGYDPEDVLQDVYRGILARNAGKCPWDPRKSSFGHYVYMICRCIVSNYGRKQRRVVSMEQLGTKGKDGADIDVGASSIPVVDNHDRATVADLQRYLEGHNGHDAARILPYVVKGLTRGEIVATVGLHGAYVTRAMGQLRALGVQWAQGC